MNLLVNVTGGEGYNAALSQVLKEAKKKYEKIYIISPYVDIFKTNPYVDYVYAPEDGQAAFEDLDIDNTYIATGRVYDTNEFIHKEINYAEAFRRWLNLNKSEYGYSTTKMELKENPQFQKIADDLLKQVFKKEKKYKNFIIMQTTGGQSALAPQNQPYNNLAQPLRRYMSPELAQGFIDKFRKLHPETAIIMYQLPNEPRYNGVEQFIVPYMVYSYLAQNKKCKGCVTIDSSLQHITAGLCKSVVLWYHTLPDSFGYEANVNIIQNCKRDSIRYFSLLGRAGNKVDEIKPEVLVAITEDTLFQNSECGNVYTNEKGEIDE